MAPGKPRDERKEQQWRQWLREWQASGLSVRGFCARRGLGVPRFYAWRREMIRRDAQQSAFVPVHVLADANPAKEGWLELMLADGRSVRIPPDFDATTLQRLLSVLEG